MAEQVVGSDVAFRKAVEEMIGRALKEGELEKMMEKGLLDPDVLLPKVGKYFSELARSGGALEIKLNQLETIEMRMKMRWEQIQKTVYDTGGEKGLKGLYRTLDQIFKMMMDENLVGGGFLKGFLDSVTQSLKNIWDWMQLIKVFAQYKLGIGVDGELLGKMAYWTALFGILGKISGLFKNILSNKNIAGLKGVMVSLGKAGLFMGATALAGSGGDSVVSQGGDMAMLVGSMFGPWGLAIGAFVKAGTLVYENWDTITKWWQDLDIKGMFQNFIESVMKTFGVDPEKNRSIFAGATGSISGAGFNAAWANSLPLFMQNKDQKVEVQNKVYIDGKEIKTVAEEVVNTSMQRQTQSIIPTGLNSNAASNN